MRIVIGPIYDYRYSTFFRVFDYVNSVELKLLPFYMISDYVVVAIKTFKFTVDRSWT